MAKCDDRLQIDQTPKLIINGKEVGVNDLNEIMKEVKDLGIEGDQNLGIELLMRVRRKDYVPPGLETEYRAALLKEYRTRYS